MYYVQTEYSGLAKVVAFPSKYARDLYLANSPTAACAINARTAKTEGEHRTLLHSQEIPDTAFVIGKQYNSSGTLRVVLALKGW